MLKLREFEENFEKYGPLMFGFHDGQSEAPKIMARKVRKKYQERAGKFLREGARLNGTGEE